MIHHILLSAAEEVAKPNILGTLGIDWKLFLAQLVNFGIVLFVFWRWVVKPLGKTLMDRQNRIESGLKNADYMEKEKNKFEQWRMNEMRKARDEADKVMKEAILASEQVKSETIAQAQSQAGKLLEQTKASLVQEKDKMLREIKQDVATLVVAASEKILHTKLDSKKDHELIHQSIKEIN